MIEASERAYLLIDSSKFEKKSLIQLTDLSKIDTIFSDQPLPDNLQKYCELHDIMTVL